MSTDNHYLFRHPYGNLGRGHSKLSVDELLFNYRGLWRKVTPPTRGEQQIIEIDITITVLNNDSNIIRRFLNGIG
jgi:hypothetical protein